MAAHGTRARYVAGCHCAACTAANRTYNAGLRRAAVYGRPTTDLVDAGPARDHVRSLLAAGMGTRAVAQAAGVQRRALQRLLTGRPDRGSAPTARITPATEQALLAVAAAPAGAALVGATGTRRRLQALVALGWSQARLADQLGVAPTAIGALLRQDRVTAATERQVGELYDLLWDTPPPRATAHERAAAARAQRHAERRGWPPPMAWDDDTIADPAAEPDTGAHVPRYRALAEDGAELLARGYSPAQAAERLGVESRVLSSALAGARRRGA